MLVSGHGRLHAGGVALEYAVGVDFPASYLLGIRNRVGGIDSPILRRYLATREPQFFEADHPDLDVPAAWLRCFLEHDMRNVAAYGVYDAERCVGTYHAFYRIPGRLGRVHAELLKQLVPIMHEALDRVIELLHVRDGLGGLSPREREMVRWVKQGKTNADIASISGVSENTVKHHLTSIFNKLAVESRAQLICKLAQHNVSLDTKVL